MLINNIERKYFAILDANGNVNYLFYPDKRYPLKTKQYLKIVRNFFNPKNP